jgi:DNA-directed RNA polymerase I subunit RPA2
MALSNNNNTRKKTTSAGARVGSNAPVETCPSFRSGHVPCDEDVIRLRTLTAPHVESFNYFLERGLPASIQSMERAELDLIDTARQQDSDRQLQDEGSGAGGGGGGGGAIGNLQDTTTVQFWISDVRVAKPSKASGSRSNRLLPRECRERSLMYAGQMSGNFCYRFIERRNGVTMPGRVQTIAKTFGELPIMVLSKECHLEGKLPRELVMLKEEVSIVM